MNITIDVCLIEHGRCSRLRHFSSAILRLCVEQRVARNTEEWDDLKLQANASTSKMKRLLTIDSSAVDTIWRGSANASKEERENRENG
jgi:hypothetical protein